MTNQLGKHLFTFAVIADSHVNQEETETSSPYECNAFANARSRYAISLLNTLNPDFCIHLGDLVHPVPSLKSYEDAIKRFKNLSRTLTGNPQTIISVEHIRRTARLRHPETPSFFKISCSLSSIKFVKKLSCRPIALSLLL